MRKYRLSVQRLGGEAGRYREIYSVIVQTLEPTVELRAMLNVGMREGWKTVVTEITEKETAR